MRAATVARFTIGSSSLDVVLIAVESATLSRSSARGDPTVSESESEPRKAPEDEESDRGAEGGSGGSKDTLPPAPDKDDSTPLGDTDQHSEADA
jgi:hypothetical protein